MLSLLDRMEALAARSLARLSAPLKILLAGGRSIQVEGQMLDPSTQLSIRLHVLLGAKSVVELGAVKARKTTSRDALVHAGRVAHVGKMSSIEIPGSAGPMKARHYAPKHGQGKPVLLYLHGG